MSDSKLNLEVQATRSGSTLQVQSEHTYCDYSKGSDGASLALSHIYAKEAPHPFEFVTIRGSMGTNCVPMRFSLNISQLISNCRNYL